MKVLLVINKKEWIRCYCCGDNRKIAKIYRGRMYFKEKNGKYECNRCDFSFAPKDLKPKPEFIETIKLMNQLTK